MKISVSFENCKLEGRHFYFYKFFWCQHCLPNASPFFKTNISINDRNLALSHVSKIVVKVKGPAWFFDFQPFGGTVGISVAKIIFKSTQAVRTSDLSEMQAPCPNSLTNFQTECSLLKFIR
jgi:hypothetical protein